MNKFASRYIYVSLTILCFVLGLVSVAYSNFLSFSFFYTFDEAVISLFTLFLGFVLILLPLGIYLEYVRQTYTKKNEEK